MLVCPPFCANVSPELRFLRTDDAHINCTLEFSPVLLDTLIKDVADLERPVVARAEQIQRVDSGKRTHFVKNGRTLAVKEVLHYFQSRRSQILEKTEPKALSDWRSDAIKDSVCSSALNPLGPAVGEQTTSCLCVLSTCVPLRPLQASREYEVRKMWSVTVQ